MHQLNCKQITSSFIHIHDPGSNAAISTLKSNFQIPNRLAIISTRTRNGLVLSIVNIFRSILLTSRMLFSTIVLLRNTVHEFGIISKLTFGQEISYLKFCRSMRYFSTRRIIFSRFCANVLILELGRKLQ